MWSSTKFGFRKKSALITAFCVMLVGCHENKDVASESQKYSRSDCIVRIDFGWSDYPEFEAKLNTLLGIGDAMIENFDNLLVPRAAFAPDLSTASHMYLQFAEDCENKREHAQTHIAKAVSAIGLDIDFSVSEDPIQPSKNTIDLQGPSWSD